MAGYRVAILGATGLVGREFLKVLAERKFPLAELRLLASDRSAGTRLPFAGEELPVEEATPNSFRGIEYVFQACSITRERSFSSGSTFTDLPRPAWPRRANRSRRGSIIRPNRSTSCTAVPRKSSSKPVTN